MISLLYYINNFVLYFVNTLYSTYIIKVTRNTISKSSLISLRDDFLCYLSCSAGIIISNKNSVFLLTLISGPTISFSMR